MFGIDGWELLVIGIVALIVIGPKELPGVLRTLGQMTTKLRRMAGEFRGQFDEAMREADLASAKKDFDSVTEAARTATSFNPLDTIRKELSTSLDGTPVSSTASSSTASASASSTASAASIAAADYAATAPFDITPPEAITAAPAIIAEAAPVVEATPEKKPAIRKKKTPASESEQA